MYIFFSSLFTTSFRQFIERCLICSPSASALSEYAGIEAITVVMFAWLSDALTTLLDLILYTMCTQYINMYMNVCGVLRCLLFTLPCPYLATSDDLIDRLGTSTVKVALHSREYEKD
jgi:hypothetical protein